SRLVTNFIDDTFILDRDKGINTEIQKILFVGHVQVTKGVKEIIQVASCLPKIEFILAGPIASEIKKLNIPKNVILKGVVSPEEVRELLGDADVFLFPTYSEGFSIALLEAMAMGVPIITTPVGANADMIE
ncbi:glycosyltransferase family 4 protein, partial [Bacillus sp. JJ634]